MDIKSGQHNKDYINGIRGWIFSLEEIEEAKKQKKMLMLDFELGVKCSLNCPFCFRREDERDRNYPALTLDQTLDIIDQAKEMDCKSVHIVGQGEPTEDERFLQVMKYIHHLGMIPLVFTSGHVIGDDDLACRYHGMGGVELAKLLCEYDVSVIVKINSLKASIQDKIVGVPFKRDKYDILIKWEGKPVKYAYTKYRDIGIQRLIDVGLNSVDPTRLGADILVLKDNYHEILDLYRYCRDLNIYPLVVTFIPCGRTATKFERDNFDIPPSKKIDLWERIYDYNMEQGIPLKEISSYAGGHICTQLEYAFYVNVRGLVYRCPGESENIGTLAGPGKTTLRELWEEHGGKVNGSMCPPRIRCGSIPQRLQDVVRDHMKSRSILVP